MLSIPCFRDVIRGEFGWLRMVMAICNRHRHRHHQNNIIIIIIAVAAVIAAAACCLLGVGCWLAAAESWLLAAGCWLSRWNVHCCAGLLLWSRHLVLVAGLLCCCCTCLRCCLPFYFYPSKCWVISRR